MTTPASTDPQPLVLGRFRGLVDPSAEADFEHGGMPLPDGTFWRFREPDAAVVVEHDRLRVLVRPLTRHHDRVQFLDNAKHMYFSRRIVEVPPAGTVAVELGMRARVRNGRDDDLYSGFVSCNLLDFESGLAFDWFLSSRRAATVYARLPFPGVRDDGGPGAEADRPRWFCVFNEVRTDLVPGDEHRFRIEYEAEAATVRFLLDGVEVDAYASVPVRMDRFLVALGVMTEKPIGEGGSVSCFGQGVEAEYTAVTIEGAAGAH